MDEEECLYKKRLAMYERNRVRYVRMINIWLCLAVAGTVMNWISLYEGEVVTGRPWFWQLTTLACTCFSMIAGLWLWKWRRDAKKERDEDAHNL